MTWPMKWRMKNVQQENSKKKISINEGIRTCKDPKICSADPLRIMGYAFQMWPKPMKFVRGGKEQQQWVLPEDSYKEESSFYSETKVSQALHQCSRGG